MGDLRRQVSILLWTVASIDIQMRKFIKNITVFWQLGEARSVNFNSLIIWMIVTKIFKPRLYLPSSDTALTLKLPRDIGIGV